VLADIKHFVTTFYNFFELASNNVWPLARPWPAVRQFADASASSLEQLYRYNKHLPVARRLPSCNCAWPRNSAPSPQQNRGSSALRAKSRGGRYGVPETPSCASLMVASIAQAQSLEPRSSSSGSDEFPVVEGPTGLSAFHAEVRGDLTSTASGDAEFGTVQNPDRSSGAFVVSLESARAERHPVHPQKWSSSRVGRYRISERANGADEIPGPGPDRLATRPTGVFPARRLAGRDRGIGPIHRRRFRSMRSASWRRSHGARAGT